jgi:hypothetical protein
MSLTLAGVLGVPLVMAIGLFVILRWGKEGAGQDDAGTPEDQ